MTTAALAVTPAPPGIATPQRGAEESGTELVELAQEAFELLNEARAAEGLRPLTHEPTLALLARHHSAEIAQRGLVSHYSIVYGLTTERRLRISFPRVPRLGENVARNRSVARLHAALLASPKHRKNRLDADFTHVGIGVARADAHTLYLAEVFVQAPGGGATLGKPVALYFEADPDAYEREGASEVHIVNETITVSPPQSVDDPEFWTHRGIEAFSGGDFRTAEQAFRRALELEPRYHFARYNLARALLLQDRPAEAADHLDALLAENPEDTDAHFSRGAAALLMEEYSRAEAAFRQVLAARPRDSGAWYNLGLSLEYQGELSAAEAAYLQALYVDPGLEAARAGLARVRG